jgi:hypothetical protein
MYVQTFQPVPPKRDSRQQNGEYKKLSLFKTTPGKVLLSLLSNNRHRAPEKKEKLQYRSRNPQK